MWSFYFPHLKHKCAIWRHGLSPNSWDSDGHKLCSTHSGVFFCYDRDFMSNLHKSKRHDLKDMFNDTSRYIDDIFTIDNPEFEKHIPAIYPTELQLNKANTSDKETFSLISISKLLAVMFIPAFTTNSMTSDFLSSISPGWVLMFLESHLMVFTFLSWLDLLGVALAFRISNLKIFNLLPNYFRRITDITSSKNIRKVLQVILWPVV